MDKFREELSPNFWH